jgi:cytochrome-b5 reductase
VYLIYGCRTAGDVYLRKEIELMQRMYPNRFSIVYVLSDEVDAGPSTGNNNDGIKTLVGQHMNKEVLEQVCGSRLLKQKDCRVWICGPPSFYNDLCGPREQTSKVGGALRSFGLKPNQVIKF